MKVIFLYLLLKLSNCIMYATAHALVPIMHLQATRVKCLQNVENFNEMNSERNAIV